MPHSINGATATAQDEDSGRVQHERTYEGREAVIHSHPEVMGGTPVFIGTRVPIRRLLDLNDFLEGFPTVAREHAIALLAK